MRWRRRPRLALWGGRSCDFAPGSFEDRVHRLELDLAASNARSVFTRPSP